MIQELLENLNIYINKIYTVANSEFITNILNRYKDLLYIHFEWQIDKRYYKKWDIVWVNLWYNVWTELNKKRPCVVYSWKNHNQTDNIVIIPIKTYKWKLIDNFQIYINHDDQNNLKNDSLINILSIRSISKKRISQRFGKLSNNDISNLDKKIMYIFEINKNKNPVNKD